MDELLTRANNLQQESQKQIKELELLTLLEPFGTVVVVGSVVTGLMTWPDVDIEVVVDQMPTKEQVGELGKLLYAKQDIFRVWLMDNLDKKDLPQPRGLYAGAKRKVGESVWKFDMWFILHNEERSGKDDISWVKNSLTDENRLIILKIKDQISNNPKYRKSIFSIDIYKAVFNEGVGTLEEFEAYLQKSSRTLY